jgi:NitT/TauT family transport system substrate-binding protein
MMHRGADRLASPGVLAAAAVIISASAQAAPPPVPVVLALQWTPQAQFAGYYLALERKLYQQRGLQVSIAHGAPDRDTAARLSTGQASFASFFLDAALYHRGRGVPLINLAQIVNRSNAVLVMRRDRGLRQLGDLNGRKISLWGDLFNATYRAFLRARRLSPQVIQQHASVNLLLRGVVDGCSAMYYNEYHVLLQAGLDASQLEVVWMRDQGFNFPEDGIYALADTCRARPQLCRDFVLATLEGWRHAAQHPEEALDAVMEKVRRAHVPTNRAHQRWMLRQILASVLPVPGDGWRLGLLAEDAYRSTVSALLAEGLIRSAPAYREFVWEPR